MISLPISLEQKLKYSRPLQAAFFALTLRKSFPHSLNIESTNLCNLNCIMCPRVQTNRGLGNIKWEFYKKIIDEIAGEKKLWTLTLIKDGEPLLHPRLDQLINYAAEKKVARRIEIFTNGILLDRKDWSRRLLMSGLDVLNISLDAATEGTYKKIRRSDEFKRVEINVKGLMKLKKRLRIKKPQVVIRAVGMKANSGELSEIERMWWGVSDGVGITPFANYAGGVSDSLGMADAGTVLALPQGPSLRERYPCLVPWYNPVINWDGKVTVCCANYLDNELIMGNMNKQTLKEIWQSEKYRQLRRDHLENNLKDWPTCRKCTYWRKFANMSWRLHRSDLCSLCA